MKRVVNIKIAFHSDLNSWAAKRLENDGGRTTMREKTVNDKIFETLSTNPKSIDNRFYVQSQALIICTVHKVSNLPKFIAFALDAYTDSTASAVPGAKSVRLKLQTFVTDRLKIHDRCQQLAEKESEVDPFLSRQHWKE